MRIARHWDHPLLQAAREQGVTLNSIQTVLKVLRCQPLKNGPGNSTDEIMDMQRDELRKEFSIRLRALTKDELPILLENSELFWERAFAGLRKTVCGALVRLP
jgi:DNA-binding transcriptional MerR regulator